MGSIILLAVAAAVYPQLLAVVLIILTRPNPQPLLWACYLTAVIVSVSPSASVSFPRAAITTAPSSAVVAVSSTATGASFTGVTVIVTVATFPSSCPSFSR